MIRLSSVAALSLLATTVAWCGSYRILHEFQGFSQDPSSGLVADAAGNLYGTTGAGGGHGNSGTVYQLSPTTGYHVIYSFSGPDGKGPGGNLLIDSAGNLYGVTGRGGSSPACTDSEGCGAIYRLSPPKNGGSWTEKTLYSFTGGDDGYLPSAGLTFDSLGNLYGTTSEGGELACGVVFSLIASENDQWTENVLYTFTGDGCGPEGGLTFDSAGNLYGTTPQTGIWGGGTVYELSPSQGGSWTYAVIHAFNPNVKDGVFPTASLVIDASGNLYGTTEGGGAFGAGTAFELTPNSGAWTETIIHHFGKDNDGSEPYSNLVFDTSGNLYGTTVHGGGTNNTCGTSGCGTLFKLAPGPNSQWTESAYDLGNGPRGIQPIAPLLLDGRGYAFGTTSSGGFINGHYADGVAFRLTIGQH